MYAQLYSTGKMEIYDHQGTLMHSGIPDKAEGEEGHSAFIDLAAALMVYNGDWPNHPVKDGERIELEDEHRGLGQRMLREM